MIEVVYCSSFLFFPARSVESGCRRKNVVYDRAGRPQLAILERFFHDPPCWCWLQLFIFYDLIKVFCAFLFDIFIPFVFNAFRIILDAVKLFDKAFDEFFFASQLRTCSNGFFDLNICSVFELCTSYSQQETL